MKNIRKSDNAYIGNKYLYNYVQDSKGIKMMKIKTLTSILIFSVFLAACGQAKATETDIASGVFTAVAQTLTAQYTPVTPSATPALATVTPTETVSNQTSTVFVTPTPMQVTSSANSCLGSLFVSDVTIPDNTPVVVGTSFTKTWSLKNSGTCPWTSSFKLKFVSGTQMNGNTTAVGSAVAAGNNVNVSVTMTAPSTAGTYTGWWRLINDKNEFFGTYIYVTIVATSSPTGTVTPTTMYSATPTITPIYIVVTATPAPTGTPTSTSEPGSTGG
jgi:hypothetical protein